MILVTGATGYVGGRLVPLLLKEGYNVRVLVRSPGKLRGVEWEDDVDITTGDVLNLESLSKPLSGIRAAFYLIHGMDEGAKYADRDRLGAQHFLEATSENTRIIYLGGLRPTGARESQMSQHLRSRLEVGHILRSSGRAIEFRAGPIIGSGSASFEMVRYLTERLPVMVAPRWVSNDVSPVAIRDVLSYLVAALRKVDTPDVIDIGGDTLSFKKMMLEYAEVRGLTRTIVPLPVLAPGLAARWVGLVTPIYNRLAVPIVRGMTSPLIANTAHARAHFPNISPLPYRRAVEDALERTKSGHVETRWTTAQGGHNRVELRDEEGLFIERRVRSTNASETAVFETVSGLGGKRGWLAWNHLWALRGLVDKLVGGPGLRRGRRDPNELFEGETVDFWRVERVVPGELLRLRAEMKLPGKAWLQWTIKSEPRASTSTDEESRTIVEQKALFEPRGLLGFLYWYGIYPLHGVIFSALIDRIVEESEK